MHVFGVRHQNYVERHLPCTLIWPNERHGGSHGCRNRKPYSRIWIPLLCTQLCRLRCCSDRTPVMPGLLRAARGVPQKHGAEQTLMLLTQPLSKELPERHLASLEHLCTQLSHGCSSRDLPVVSRVLGTVIGNVKAEPNGRFLEVACELLT